MTRSVTFASVILSTISVEFLSDSCLCIRVESVCCSESKAKGRCRNQKPHHIQKKGRCRNKSRTQSKKKGNNRANNKSRTVILRFKVPRVYINSCVIPKKNREKVVFHWVCVVTTFVSRLASLVWLELEPAKHRR